MDEMLDLVWLMNNFGIFFCSILIVYYEGIFVVVMGEVMGGKIEWIFICFN
jgi:hypothetical protein